MSSKHDSGSIAPRERINIKFQPTTGNKTAEVELPLNLLVAGNLIGGTDDTPMDERQLIAIDRNNFNAVLEQSGIKREFTVSSALSETPDARSQMHFTHRSHLRTLPPESFYLDLVRLLGELMTFTEDSRLPCPVDVYNHRDLTQSFKTVIPELRRALNTVLMPRAQNLPLAFSDGFYVATVNDPTLLQAGTFILAVRARMPHGQLIHQFTQQSKVAATNKIRDMVSVQVPGVPLTPRTAAPRQLPYHDGFVYFELDKGAAAWQDVVKAGALGLHISGSFPELNIQLWAIRG